LPWQLCRHDCARLSQLLRQGPLNVTGQTRRHEASSFEHFVRQASTAPRPLDGPPPVCASAPNETAENKATQNRYFMAFLPPAEYCSIIMDAETAKTIRVYAADGQTQQLAGQAPEQVDVKSKNPYQSEGIPQRTF
jgi:hypothetical protein